MNTHTDAGLTPFDLLDQYHGDEIVSENDDKHPVEQTDAS
jgi:hypothetical protein